MTREEAIEAHRKMWNWIADESEKTGKIKNKLDYHVEMGLLKNKEYYYPINGCYICEYALEICDDGYMCDFCPIGWGSKNGNHCNRPGSPFYDWENLSFEEGSISSYAKLARTIANLPLKEELR